MNRQGRLSILAIGAALVLFGPVQMALAATAVGLGTTSGYAILGGSTITNTGSSVITGDLGLSPGTSVMGFPPGVLNGVSHVTDASAATAQTDLIAAYNDAAGQSPTTTTSTELGSTTKTAGVYNSADGTFEITGTLTLDAQGDASAVFIFKTASTLITASSSVVALVNGAQACNVFWQVGSSATLGTDSIFKGSILALTSATLNTGANVNGRVLARNGAVTLDSNVITVASCATTTTTTTTTSATTATTATPLIKVTKTALPDGLPVGAGSVTYNYAVTNTGTLPLNDIKVTDDKCATVSHISGDTNRNGLIETAETWLYHCVTTLLNTTTNIVTASGTANGQTATATATATVVVGHPTLPNTGTPPVDRPWLWPSAAGVVILGYLAFKYRRIF